MCFKRINTVGRNTLKMKLIPKANNTLREKESPTRKTSMINLKFVAVTASDGEIIQGEEAVKGNINEAVNHFKNFCLQHFHTLVFVSVFKFSFVERCFGVLCQRSQFIHK